MWQIQRGSDILVHGSGFPPLGFCCGDKNYKGKTTFFVLKTHHFIARARFFEEKKATTYTFAYSNRLSEFTTSYV